GRTPPPRGVGSDPFVRGGDGAAQRPARPGPRHDLRTPGRDPRVGAVDCRIGDLSGGGSARLDLARPGAGNHRPGALRRGAWCPTGAAATQRSVGHHCHSRHGRAIAGGPAPLRPYTQESTLPQPAVQRREGFHRAGGQTSAGGGNGATPTVMRTATPTSTAQRVPVLSPGTRLGRLWLVVALGVLVIWSYRQFRSGSVARNLRRVLVLLVSWVVSPGA